MKSKPHLNCGNCEFARAREAKHGGDAGRAEQSGLPLACLREPFFIFKANDDVCGDHSELMAERQRELAREIVKALRPS